MKVPASFGGRRRELIDNTNAKMNSVKAELFVSSLPGEALLAVRSQPRRTMQCILRPPGVFWQGTTPSLGVRIMLWWAYAMHIPRPAAMGITT
jgi:hypothetical protein